MATVNRVPNFWQWYYKQGIQDCLLIYRSAILIVYDYFSIPFLIKTLFYPWKKDVVSPETPTLQLMVQAFWMNLIVRLLGAIIRSWMIFAGGLMTLGTVILGGLLVLYAFVLPLGGVVLIIPGLLFLASGDIILVSTGSLMIILGLMSYYIALHTWGSDRWRDYPPATPLNQVPLETSDLESYLSIKSVYLLDRIDQISQIKEGLLGSPEIGFILNRINISPDEFVATPLPPEIDKSTLLKTAAKAAVSENHTRILLGDLFLAVAQLDPSLKPTLVEKELTDIDLFNVVAWQSGLWEKIYTPSPLLQPDNLRSTGGIGRDWAAGYTNYLDLYAANLNEIVTSNIWDHQFVAHAPQIENIERVLSRSGRHNVLMVGETGVGKRTAVLGFTRRVLTGRTLRPLQYKRVVELDVSAILANINNPGEIETRLVRLLNEAVSAGNVILYIDDIERLLTVSPDGVGSVNAAEILLPYLASPNLQLIGTIPPAEYHSAISRQPSLAASFERIDIIEPDEQSTIRIIQDIAPAIEARYQIIVSYQSLRQVVRQSARYIPNRRFPEKAIEILDEIGVDVSSRNEKIVTSESVDRVISQKANVPVGDTNTQEKETLLNLEELLHQRVVNQVTAIDAISNALRRARSGVGSDKKPIGTFLFLGPTGVGKTETAKALSEIYFKSESAMIRFDMTEYQEATSLRRLIGDDTDNSGGLLTDAIRDKPFTCLLLDEIEKAHPRVLDVFLQVLDEGRLTDSLGQPADFKNAIIIATSNAGANWLRNEIEKSSFAVPVPQSPAPMQAAPIERSPLNEESAESISSPQPIDMETISKGLLDYVQDEGIFRPEFLNRFDAVVAFRPLTAEELEKVVDLMLASLNKRLSDRQITVTLSPATRTRLAQIGFDPVFGARALSRKMVELVENRVAEALLQDKLQKGQTFEITPEMIQ